MKFEFYREGDDPFSQRIARPTSGDWRWRLRAKNGRIVAEGGEGYRRSPEMVRTIRNNLCPVPGTPLFTAMKDACTAAGLDFVGRTLKRKARGRV